MTTSRTPLRIAAEREYPLAPLELPPQPEASLEVARPAMQGHHRLRRGALGIGSGVRWEDSVGDSGIAGEVTLRG